MNEGDTTSDSRNVFSHWIWFAAEVLLIVGWFWFYGGQPGPDVNETHYLTKAKQFWNPQWCEGDLFLGSSNPHLLFYWMFGWLSILLPLGTFAMVGRFVTWILLAAAWRSLSTRVINFRLASVLTAVIWLTLLDRCHMAGEWVVGGFESKGLAYAFVLWSLAAMLDRRWGQVWIYVGIASAFHVLVGGWAGVCFAVVWITLVLNAKISANPDRASTELPNATVNSTPRSPSLCLPYLLVGGLISLLGVIPPLVSNPEVADETIQLANRINVTQRLRHHQLFDAFSSMRVGLFCGLVFAWVIGQKFLTMLTRQQTTRNPAKADVVRASNCQRLNLFALAALAICVCGILLSGLSNSDSATSEVTVDLLIYYWFRLSDFAVPMAATFVAATLLQHCRCCVAGKVIAVVLVLVSVVGGGWVCLNRWEDPRPIADRRSLPEYEGRPEKTFQTYVNWRLACDWVRQNTPEDAVFLTPAKQQTFKWYAHRAEVVNWKDSPQDAARLVEWRSRIRRFQRTQFEFRHQGGLWAYSDEQLQEIANEYGATHIMTLQADFESRPVPGTSLKQIYPQPADTRSTYVVFELL